MITCPSPNTIMPTYKGLTADERRAQYQKDRNLIREARYTEVAFIGSPLKLRMGVTVFGGCTGRGKSTTNANILADFYGRYVDRQAFVITNEERSSDVLDRISCIILNYDFFAYRAGQLSPDVTKQVEDHSLDILTQRIEVVSAHKMDMTCLEDVIDVLQAAAVNPEINLILIDYLQTVSWSRVNRDANQYEISKSLGLFLKEYGRTAKIPVIIFAQVAPLARDRNGQPVMADFSGRVQGDKTFANHAIMCVEILPDFEGRTTQFYIHKDRFGDRQGRSLTFDWRAGCLRRR